jgi:hypothetical protein
MALPPSQQRILDDIDARLRADDPQLAMLLAAMCAELAAARRAPEATFVGRARPALRRPADTRRSPRRPARSAGRPMPVLVLVALVLLTLLALTGLLLAPGL